MVTKRYAHILDEDRRSLAAEMESSFYQKNAPEPVPVPVTIQATAPALDENTLAKLIAANLSLLMKILQSVQLANNG